MVGLRIMDMQVGEKFITNSAHSNAEELVRRSNSWSTWTVRSDDYRGAVAGGHLLYLSPGTMLEKLFNAEGDTVYMCVPENG